MALKRGFAAMKDELHRDEYMRRLDVRAVLDHYGMDNEFEEAGREGTVEVRHSCLLERVESHHKNRDANPSATANLGLKKYLCRTFWGGDMFEFMMKMEDKDDFAGILPLVREFLGEGTLSQDNFLAELEKLFARAAPVGPAFGLQGYSERILTPWRWVHPYLATRGIDSGTANRLQIGWREDLNRITIPVWWQDRLVGWQARAIPDRPGQWPGTWGGGFPKYKSSPGFPKSGCLYDPVGRGGRGPLVVVESPFSVIKSIALGLDRRVVATFGSKVSQRQIDIIADLGQRTGGIVVWADDDDAGRIMERKLVHGLMRRADVRVVAPDQDMDLGDYDSIESVEAKIDSSMTAVAKTMEY